MTRNRAAAGTNRAITPRRSRGGLSTKIHAAVDGRGRPVSYEKNTYRGRNLIERAFKGFKHWRGLATQYLQARRPLSRRSRPGRRPHLARRLKRLPLLARSVSCRCLVRSAQRSCGAATNSMRMAALSTTFEPALLKRVKNLLVPRLHP